MADQSTPTPAPSAESAPSELELEVASVLSFADDVENDIAALGSQEPAAGGEPSAAGGGVDAPSSPPVTTPAATDAPQTPATSSPSPASPAPAASTPSTPTPAAPTAQQPPSAEALRVQSLEAQVEALTASLTALQSKPQTDQPQTGEQPVSTGDQPPQPVRYGLTIPPQVADALNSDDDGTRVAALNTLINDVGTIIHNAVLKQVRDEVGGMFQQLNTAATQGTEQQQRNVAAAAAKDAYYQAFPDHNNDLILPFVQTEAQKMAVEFPHLKWGPDYINALGARVEATLNVIRGGQQPQPTVVDGGVGNGAPPARPAAMLPSGNRGNGNMTPVETGDDFIMDTLSPFGG